MYNEVGGSMNFILNGNFYLVARYYDNSHKIIKLNLKKFLNLDEDCYQKGNDIAFIDYLTINYDSLGDLKKTLFENGVIKTMDVDLYIVHPNKYNGKTYLKEYNLLCGTSRELKEHLINFMQNRLNNVEIKNNDADIKHIADKFLAKISYNNNFYKFVVSPDTKIDKFLKENLIKFKNNKNPYFMYYYMYKKTFDSYINIRNIVDTMMQYENLKNEINYQTEEEFYKKLITLYISKLDENNDRRKIYDDLVRNVNTNFIEGQIRIEEMTTNEEEIDDDLEFLTDEELSSMTNSEGYKYYKK